MGEEKSIRDKVVVVAEADLERREGLLVVLQRIDILSGATVRETESGNSHDRMRELLDISIRTHLVTEDMRSGTYRWEMGRFPLEEVNTESHAIAVESVRVQTSIMRKQLFPHHMPEMSIKRRILLPLSSLVIHARVDSK
jgi:hypothetical protein